MDLVELQHPVQRRHPWEVARLRFFRRVLERAGALAGGGAVLDVGSGDAWLAASLAASHPSLHVVCWDSGYSDEVVSRLGPRPENVTLVRERPARTFGLLLLLDVLEHIADDGTFLEELVRSSVAPGGLALLAVPAWPALFSAHDAHLRHHRRYTPAQARALFEGAGLEIVSSGGLFHALLLPRAAAVMRERLSGRSSPPPDLGRWDVPPLVGALVAWALACDALVSTLAARLGVSLPGLSFWALCRKPSR